MKKMIAALAVTGILLSGPLNSEAALGDRTLQANTTHQDVKELQNALQKKGFFNSSHRNAYFGKSTKKAVINFQKKHGLRADGVVGANTYKALGVTKKATSQVKAASYSSSSNLVSEAKKYIGVSYKWGGTTPSGFDCSGFLKYVFDNGAGITIPRTVADIYKAGTKVSSPKTGDIVFFETYKKGASHAGIYMGGNQFIHTSSSKGVSVASLDNSYWSQRYLGAKRITK
ncbi:NlpC/P60 family protein [Domibacillus sp. A3M-37]|uniref:C40 family peptidase n=1 Tax=Domibacillus sp. A3M-37 TaxID=2962037 RepID=UPI0020B7AB28|nr:NlpC/P60 family protein [Domibacillus sp. A3M-37]MCP3764666.1 NlpC/P60 family protein [Domibacillus sp. A3M-37]